MGGSKKHKHIVKFTLTSYDADMKISKQKLRNQDGLAHLGAIVLVLLVVGFIGFVAYKVKNGGGNDKQSQGGGQLSLSKDCTGKGKITMGHLPMDMDDVQVVLPIGTLAGAHVTPIDHLYFYPKDMQNRDAAPVYAMADGKIISYQERTQNVDQGTAKQGEYRIEIQHNCDIVSYFDLLTSLDDSIKSKLAGGERNVPVKAGQVIGRVGAQSLDTAVYNYGMTLKGFVNPKSYEAEPWKIHTDDFFKYFNDDMSKVMLAKNPRSAEPRGGKIDYDIKGKLVGNWFEEGTNGYAGAKEFQNGNNPGGGKGYWNGHFSIAPDAINPDVTNLSFGYYQSEAKQFSAKDGSPDPATIGQSDGVVKYELVQYLYPPNRADEAQAARSQEVKGTVLLQVLDNDKLKLETFPGKTASQVTGFTSVAKTYKR